jgi:Fe2+ transport system protein FeoA
VIRCDPLLNDTPIVPVRLCDLEEGCEARFHEASLDTESRELLRALGLTASSMIRLCKRGEPCIVQVRATRIGLSKLVAGQIYVIPESREAV